MQTEKVIDNPATNNGAIEIKYGFFILGGSN